MNLQDHLTHAVRRCDVSQIEFLLEHIGASIDALDSRGDAALHYAASQDTKIVTELLLNKGADVNVRNSSQQTPLDRAVYKKLEVVKVLLDRGARVELQDMDGKSPIHRAVENIERPFPALNIDGRRTISELLQHGAYSYINPRFDQMLERCWEKHSVVVGRLIPFYTSLLLAGVQTSDNQVKQAELITVKHHTEQTVSAWLAPLRLSQEAFAQLTPRVLRALPQLMIWLDHVWREKAQELGGKIFEDTVQDTQNQNFVMRFKEAVPLEMLELVKAAFTQTALEALVVDRLQSSYNLPLKVAEYLPCNVRKYPSEYNDFYHRFWRHDWLLTPCEPPQVTESIVEVTGSRAPAALLIKKT